MDANLFPHVALNSSIARIPRPGEATTFCRSSAVSTTMSLTAPSGTCGRQLALFLVGTSPCKASHDLVPLQRRLMHGAALLQTVPRFDKLADYTFFVERVAQGALLLMPSPTPNAASSPADFLSRNDSIGNHPVNNATTPCQCKGMEK